MTRPSGLPGRNCPRCPRLVTFREHWRELEPQWFNAPVDSFGSPTIQNDLEVFDRQFGFPDPVLQIDQFGTIPPFDSTA